MSSADLAEEQNHVCPRFVSRYASVMAGCSADAELQTYSNVIEILQGRHPVIESALMRRDHKAFVPNDIHLGRQTGNFVLITGPNMYAIIKLIVRRLTFPQGRQEHRPTPSGYHCPLGASRSLCASWQCCSISCRSNFHSHRRFGRSVPEQVYFHARNVGNECHS